MLDPRLTDKKWRMEHLYKVVNKNGNLVTFRRNRAQKHFAENHANRNLILKSRKLGFTTDEAIDSLDDVLFTPNFDAIMLSYDQVSQLDCFDTKILTAWNNLPVPIQSLYTLDADRANKLKFNWNPYTSSISVRTHGRSGTFQRLHISEFGKICKNSPSEAREIISGTIAAVPLHGRADIESTAEGDYGLFRDMFWEAYKRGDPRYPGEFKAFFYNWTYEDDEISQIKELPLLELPVEFREYAKQYELTGQQITYYYFKWLSLAMDWDILHQEYPTTPEEAFTTSGDRFFAPGLVDKFVTRQPLSVNGNWRYFGNYNATHRYAIAADPAGGNKGDNATIAVWDFDAKPKAEVVAIYACDTISPDTFAYEIVAAGRAFGNPIACVERNAIGYATLAILKNIYYNIYKEEDFMNPSVRPNDTETNRLGWYSSKNSKTKMFYDFRTAVNDQSINIPDDISKQEIRSYPKDNLGAKNDAGGKHWDRVSAIVMGYQMLPHATTSRKVTITSPSVENNFNKFNIISTI